MAWWFWEVLEYTGKKEGGTSVEGAMWTSPPKFTLVIEFCYIAIVKDFVKTWSSCVGGRCPVVPPPSLRSLGLNRSWFYLGYTISIGSLWRSVFIGFKCLFTCGPTAELTNYNLPNYVDFKFSPLLASFLTILLIFYHCFLILKMFYIYFYNDVFLDCEFSFKIIIILFIVI